MENINLDRLRKEISNYKDIKESRDYYKKECERLKKDAQYNISENERKKNLLIIGGYGGIEIPIDEDIKKGISSYISQKVREFYESDKEHEEKFIKIALGYKNAFIRIFTPVVKEILGDIDLSVSFNPE